MSDPIELARWQGAIDERTKSVERRMDALNGDVRVIRNDITEIKNAVNVSAQFRTTWTALLEQMRETTAVTKALHDQRSRWLNGWRLRLLATGGIITTLATLTNIVLNAIS